VKYTGGICLAESIDLAINNQEISKSRGIRPNLLL